MLEMEIVCLGTGKLHQPRSFETVPRVQVDLSKIMEMLKGIVT